MALIWKTDKTQSRVGKNLLAVPVVRFADDRAHQSQGTSGGGESAAKVCGRRATDDARRYTSPMPLVDQIQKDIVSAMKSRDEARLSTLRMVKTALMSKKIEKMAELDEKESQQVLATLIKQRKDSIEQFTKGGRQEMADKEAAEIKLIETYLPKAASEEEIVAGVKAIIAEMGSPTMKDMGAVMKNAMAKFAAQGMRVDGKVVSDSVKKELAAK